MVLKYDYIFIGAGCAGLSLITRMIAAGLTHDKKILLVDRVPKTQNDRTWCFWEKGPGFFQPVVCKQWDQLLFHSAKFSKRFAIEPYQYKMIRGIDFYQYCLASVNKQSGIDTLFGNVTDIQRTGEALQVTIDNKPYSFEAPLVFNSIYDDSITARSGKISLLQHFKGWMIETASPFFIPNEATLMDFRVPQINGTTFVYVLPLSDKKALIEYTLFSEALLPDHIYNEGLENYINTFLQPGEYRVIEQEFGVIPMTTAAFPWFANGMYWIGTAGGQTKSSSGYTFQFIQKQSASIVKRLLTNSLTIHHRPGKAPARFRFYDNVLLQVLAKNYATGSEVFARLFEKNNTAAIFQFLDSESSVATDLRIITSLPVVPFLKAAGKQISGL